MYAGDLTNLQRAARDCHLNSFLFLIEQGADVGDLRCFTTHLKKAIYKGKIELIKLVNDIAKIKKTRTSR